MTPPSQASPMTSGLMVTCASTVLVLLPWIGNAVCATAVAPGVSVSVHEDDGARLAQVLPVSVTLPSSAVPVKFDAILDAVTLADVLVSVSVPVAPLVVSDSGEPATAIVAVCGGGAQGRPHCAPAANSVPDMQAARPVTGHAGSAPANGAIASCTLACSSTDPIVVANGNASASVRMPCLLYTSDAADDLLCVDL